MDLVRAVELLRELIAIPSVNPMGGDVPAHLRYEHRLSDWLERFFNNLNVPCIRTEVVPERPNIVAHWSPPQARGRLLIDVHQDTVPVDGMTVPPFQATITQDRVYGRGAVDLKGSLAAILTVVEHLAGQPVAGGPQLWLSCTCDEEATMLGIRRLVRGWQAAGATNADGIPRPDAAVVAEPTQLNVVTAHRGVIRWKVRTVGRACHSSDLAGGINAVYAMADVLSWFRRESQRLQEQVAPDRLCGSATMNVGTIHGGTSVNVVPAACEIEVERRLLPGEDPIRTWETMRQHCLASCNGTIQWDRPHVNCPPLDDSRNGPLARHLQHVAQSCGVDSRIVGVGFSTHASTLAAAGVPTVVFGPGSIEQAHTADEYIEMSQLERAIEIWRRLCTTPLPRTNAASDD